MGSKDQRSEVLLGKNSVTVLTWDTVMGFDQTLYKYTVRCKDELIRFWHQEVKDQR